MGRKVKGALGLLGVAVGLLVAACAPSPSATDSNSVGQSAMPPEYSGTPGVQGVRGTPGTRATPSPEMIQNTLANLDQFRDQLRMLAGASPTPADLIGMVQKAGALMSDIHLEINQMTPEQKDMALQRMSEVTLEMSRVWETHARMVVASGTPTVAGTPWPTMGTPWPTMGTPWPMMGTPGPMMGTPGRPMGTPGPMMGGTPSAAVSSQYLLAAVDDLRSRMMTLAADKPTEQDIIGILDHMQFVLVSMRQQLNTMSPGDQEMLTDSLARAMNDLLSVVQTHIQLETGAIPTVTVIPTMTSTPAPTGTSTPVATLMPTSTPVSTATPMPAATATPMPTATTEPTFTPVPTATVAPTSTPVPTVIP